MKKELNLLGLARRAGKSVLGTDSVVKMLPSKKIRLIFVASDASSGTFDKLDKKAYFYQIPVINKYTSLELSKALGVPLIKVIGIADEGFANAISKEIERGELQ